MTTPDTIVLVHGFWVTPRSWEHWITHYEAKGFRVIAPAYPGFEVEVEALQRRSAISSGGHRPGDRRATSRGSSEALDPPPIIIGHSAGGAFTQLLLDHGSAPPAWRSTRPRPRASRWSRCRR